MLVGVAPLPDRVPVCFRVVAALLRPDRSAGILRTAARAHWRPMQQVVIWQERQGESRETEAGEHVLELCIQRVMHYWITTVLGTLANVLVRRCWMRGDDHGVDTQGWTCFFVNNIMKL